MKKHIFYLFIFLCSSVFSQNNNTKVPPPPPPHDNNPTDQLIISHYRKAKEYANKNDFQKAIEEYTESIKLVPRDFFAYWQRGEMYQKLGKTEEACNDWYKVQELKKNLADNDIAKYCKIK